MPMDDLTPIDEVEGKAILQSIGLKVPKGRVADFDALSSAAADIGYPVVLKMTGSGLEHKTEAGAVALHLESKEVLIEAARRMIQSVRLYDPSSLSNLFLVEEMAEKPLAELIIAIRQDQQFGWVLTLGSGGIFVELIKDIKHVLLPTNAEAVEQALRNLKMGKLLSGFRGAKPANLKLLSAQIMQLCQKIQVAAPHLAEIEINPLFVYSDKIIAVDVLGQKGKIS